MSLICRPLNSFSRCNQSCCWISRVVLPAEYWWNFIALVGSGVGRKNKDTLERNLGFISIYRVGLRNSLVQLDAGSDKKKRPAIYRKNSCVSFLEKKNHVFSFLFGVMSLLSCMWMSTFACKEEEHRWIDTRDFGVYTFFSTHVYRPMMTANAPIHGGSTLRNNRRQFVSLSFLLRGYLICILWRLIHVRTKARKWCRDPLPPLKLMSSCLEKKWSAHMTSMGYPIWVRNAEWVWRCNQEDSLFIGRVKKKESFFQS